MTRIPLENLPNTRDLGGIINKHNKVIKCKKLIRSGQLFNMSQNDAKVLKDEYHLSCVVDFRSLREVEEKKDPVIEGVNYVHLPLMHEIAKGITRDKKSDNDTVKMIVLEMANDLAKAEKYMENIYQDLINSDFALSQYAKFIFQLLENKNGSTLFHCTAGKDRAGFATVIILECLDVDRETIINDYLLTNEYSKGDVNKMVETISQICDSKIIRQVVQALFGIKRSYLENIYKVIEERYGSFKGFLNNKLNIKDEDIKQLQDMYLE